MKFWTLTTSSPTRAANAASAILCIQRMAEGRAVLGIGRGDSALAHIGKAPARVRTLENYLIALQGYLKGDEVPFDVVDFNEDAAPDVRTLGLSDTPEASALRWTTDDDVKVPVEVAATGPKVIDIGARAADRVMLALGADTQRLKWGVDTATEAAEKVGKDVALGAYVNMVCHPEIDVARSLVQGGLSTFARFSVMHGRVKGTVSRDQEVILNKLHEEYDMKEHTRADSRQASVLTRDFIDSYAIVGDPAHCIERINQIASLGIDKVVVIGPTAGVDREVARDAESLLASEVLPAFD